MKTTTTTARATTCSACGTKGHRKSSPNCPEQKRARLARLRECLRRGVTLNDGWLDDPGWGNTRAIYEEKVAKLAAEVGEATALDRAARAWGCAAVCA